MSWPHYSFRMESQVKTFPAVVRKGLSNQLPLKAEEPDVAPIKDWRSNNILSLFADSVVCLKMLAVLAS